MFKGNAEAPIDLKTRQSCFIIFNLKAHFRIIRQAYTNHKQTTWEYQNPNNLSISNAEQIADKTKIDFAFTLKKSDHECATQTGD